MCSEVLPQAVQAAHVAPEATLLLPGLFDGRRQRLRRPEVPAKMKQTKEQFLEVRRIAARRRYAKKVGRPLKATGRPRGADPWLGARSNYCPSRVP
jgi:hypothetical protein